jgi:OOP family OmpA-OmpF porin
MTRLRLPGLSAPSRRLAHSLVAVLVAAFVVGGAGGILEGTAQAQLKLRGLALDSHSPSTPGSDWFMLESLDFRGQTRPALRLGFEFLHKPFVYDNAAGDQAGEIVKRQIALNVGVALNIVERLKLAVDLPIYVDQVGESGVLIGSNPQIEYPGPDGAGIGDIRATADLRLFGEYGDPFTLAVGAHVFFPTGKEENYLSDGVVRVLPRLMMAGQAGLVAWAVNLGVHFRDEIEDTVFQGVGVGHQLYGGAALGVMPVPQVLIGAELYGMTDLVHSDFFEKRATPAELLFGVRGIIADQVRLGVGVAPGLTNAIGTPGVRVMAKLEWFPGVAPTDRDMDGVPDDVDACPDTPGVRTTVAATNGCPPPPPDRDRDGILDNEDACPDDPGERTDSPATNGCPPPKDRDGDGVFDPADACPDQAGEKTNDPATNGCPPADQDKDGVLDKDDACPTLAGEKTDDPKTSGCPDTDKDGIRDPEDACPDLPGARDADPKKNGCPLARVERGQVRIIEQVKFKTGSATILPESYPILEAVAKILKEHPEIKKVRVEGHTDNRGGKALNKRLSARRAQSVMRWLTAKGGIPKGNLTSVGHGMDKPLEDNSTEDGRRENRRVEFHIVDPPMPPEAPLPATPTTP